MLNLSAITTRTAALLEASTALSRCRSREEVIRYIDDTLRQVMDGNLYDLVWTDGGEARSLLRHESALPHPSSLARTQMDEGQVVVDEFATYAPLLVAGRLRGWLAVAGDVPVDTAFAVWAAQCGATLGTFDPTTPNRNGDQERAALDEIAQVLSSTLDLDLLLKRISALVEGLVAAQGFYIALTDDAARYLSFAYLGLPEGEPLPDVRWSVDEGLTGLVVRTGQSICTDDYVQECQRRGITPKAPSGLNYSRAWLGVPLRHHDHTFGVMVVSHDAPEVRYSEHDIRLLSTVAAQAAAAVANAQLYARTQQQTNQLALVNRIGRTIVSTLDPRTVPMLLVRELREALDVESALVLMEDAAGVGLEVRYAEPELGLTGVLIPAHAGLAPTALLRDEVLIEHDVPTSQAFYAPLHERHNLRVRSLLCAPVRGRQVRAVIELQNKRSGQFGEPDVELIEAIAEQAAIALDNALLYGQTDEALAAHIRDLEERNQRLADVVEVGNALRSTLSVSQLASLLAETIQRMSGAPRVLLGLTDQDRDQVRIESLIGVDRPVSEEPAWLNLNQLHSWVEGSPTIGTLTYHLGRHPLLPGFEDAVFIPLRQPGGTLVGVVVFDLQLGPLSLSANQVRTLEIIANQGAIALNNAALYREQQLSVDRLTALNGLSLAVSTSQLSPEDVARMAVAGAIGTTGGECGGAALMLNGRPVVIYGGGKPERIDPALAQRLVDIQADYLEWSGAEIPASLADEKIKRLLVVPLRGAKMSIGTLWIGYAHARVTPAQREMAVLYAKVAGGVIENLFLATAVRTAHDRMASVLSSTREGMLLVGEDDQVAMVNRAFGRLLGVDEQTLQDRGFNYLCGAEGELEPVSSWLKPLCEAVHEVISGRSELTEGEVTPAGDDERNLTWHVIKVRGVSGEQGKNGALLVMRDVTAERQTERLRQDLANMIVHDLRSPLTNMMVSVDLLLKRTTGPLTESQSRILHIASSSCQQMLDLVNALLDIRRLEKRSHELQRQPVDLIDVVETVIERLERRADERQVQLVARVEGLPLVEADPEMLRRILQNLVDNAVKFSPLRGQVVIAGRTADAQDLPGSHAEGAWVVVEVNDRGPGVPKEYSQVIFELFGQAPHGQGQGTGLGLAFCRMAVEAHGGMIWVENNGDHGASFRFTLPVVRSMR